MVPSRLGIWTEAKLIALVSFCDKEITKPTPSTVLFCVGELYEKW